MKDEDSLLHKIFKARDFFSKGKFLEFKMGITHPMSGKVYRKLQRSWQKGVDGVWGMEE